MIVIWQSDTVNTKQAYFLFAIRVITRTTREPRLLCIAHLRPIDIVIHSPSDLFMQLIGCVWTTLLGDHPGIIPVDFGQNPMIGFNYINAIIEFFSWSLFSDVVVLLFAFLVFNRFRIEDVYVKMLTDTHIGGCKMHHGQRLVMVTIARLKNFKNKVQEGEDL